MVKELQECLHEERTALIELKTEIIVQTNFKKEDLGRQLTLRRKEFSQLAKELGTIPENWKERWQPEWEKIEVSCKSNQDFIRHSLKNLNLIVDNLKRIFGENPTYSPTGKKVDGSGSGKMVEASI